MPIMERHSNESVARLDKLQKEYAKLKEQAQNFDIDKLQDLCCNIRPQVEYDTKEELYKIYCSSVSRDIFNTVKIKTDKSMGKTEKYSVRKRLENYRNQKSVQKN